jgi:hypothetical protein
MAKKMRLIQLSRMDLRDENRRENEHFKKTCLKVLRKASIADIVTAFSV